MQPLQKKNGLACMLSILLLRCAVCAALLVVCAGAPTHTFTVHRRSAGSVNGCVQPRMARHEHGYLRPVLTVNGALQVSALQEEQAPARG